jgi:hypothetical protein
VVSVNDLISATSIAGQEMDRILLIKVYLYWKSTNDSYNDESRLIIRTDNVP